MSPSTVLNFNVDTIDNLKVLGKDWIIILSLLKQNSNWLVTK
jgi:hypothetical protein